MKKNEPTVYAFVTRSPWKLGETRTLILKSVRTTAQSQVSIVGQTGQILEYRPDVIPKTTWRQDAQGLHITATTAQRMYDDRRWSQPVVLRITQAEPALKPPQVVTRGARFDAGAWVLEGELLTLGDAPSVQVSFQYRPRKGLTDLYEKTEPWRDVPAQPQTQSGRFTMRLPGVGQDQDYEFRALVRHPLLTLYGSERPLH